MGRRPDLNTYMYILQMIDQGLYPRKMAKVLGISQPALSKKLKRLEQAGLIKKIKSYPVFYELTPWGKKALVRRDFNLISLSVRETPGRQHHQPVMKVENVRFHNLAIKLKIIKDNPAVKGSWEKEVKNWIKKFFRVDFPIPMTVEKTTKSVIIYLDTRSFSPTGALTEITPWIMKSILFVSEFMKKKGILVDVFDPQVIRQHIANEIQGKTRFKTTAFVRLGRKARSIHGQMDQMASAWLDHSTGSWEIETNDLSYEEKFLLMPEIVWQFNKNLALHLDVLRKMSETLDLIRKELSRRD